MNNSRTFNESQRGRFYVNAEMLRNANACNAGLQDYLEVFGEGDHKFNKAFIRKAVKHDLNLDFLAYKADSLYNTKAERLADEAYQAFYKTQPFWKNMSKAHDVKRWVEAFTEAGYI